MFDDREFESLRIQSSSFVLLAAEGVVDAEPGSVVSLASDVPVAVATLSSLQGRRLASYIRDRDLDPGEPGKLLNPANTYQGLMALVQSGQCAVLGPASAFSGMPGVCSFRVAGFDLEVSSHLVWPRGSTCPELPFFVQTCRRWAAGLDADKAR